MYLHATNYQNILSGLKFKRILQPEYGEIDIVILGHSLKVPMSYDFTEGRAR